MNKKGKIMLVLLSAAVMTAGAFGIAGCKDKTDKTKATDVYQSYVAYAEEHGQEPMTYEQWLETVKGNVFIKGDTGATGAPGAPGAPGLPGEPGEPGAPGKGVEDVKLSDDGKSLEIIYTNNTKDVIELPETITHVHQYDDTVITLIPVSAEEDRDGLGYKVCNDNGCEHIELVVINKYYNITVTVDGQPEAGVDVIINGARATTNENGLAKVQGFGNYNDYIITVDSPGYTTDQVYRTSGGATQEVALSRTLTRHPNNGNPYYTFDNPGVYNVGIAVEDWFGMYECAPMDVKLFGGETEAKKYKISVVDDANKINAAITDNNGKSLLTDGVYTVVLGEGEEVKIVLKLNSLVLGTGTFTDGQILNYSLKIEELETPAVGSQELPAKVVVGETNNLMTDAADADGWVYYQYFNTSNDITKVSFDLNNVEAEFTCKQYVSWKYSDKATAEVVEAGKALTLMTGDSAYLNTYGDAVGSYKFRVKATGANPSFKLNISADPGTKFNANPITLGTQASASVTDDTTQWFKYTVATAGFYTVVADNVASVAVYKGMPADRTTSSLYTVDGKSVVNLEAGEYYFEATPKNNEGAYSCGFTFKAYDDVADKGYGSGKPVDVSVDLTSGSASFDTIDAGKDVTTYYTFTAPADGTLTVSSTEYARISTSNGIATSRNFKAGETVLISARNDSSSGSFAVNLVWVSESATEPVAVEHTFTIKDNSDDMSFANCQPVAGVIVTVKNSEGVVATSSATDANGQVKLSFIPGSYTIELSGYNAETYSFEGASTSADSFSYNIRLNSEKNDYKFTVQSGGIKFAGATVTIKKGATVIKSGVTDNNGEVTFSNVFIPMTGELTYTVQLAGEDADKYAISFADTYYMTIGKGNKEETERTVDFKALVEYSFKVANVTGGGVQGIKVELTNGNSYNPQVYASAVTGLDGVAKIKMVAGMYGLQFGDVPAGHNVSCNTEYVNASNFSYEAQYLDGDHSATGAASADDVVDYGDGEIGTGINVLTNNDGVNYYGLTNVRGRYTLRIEDEAGKGYISYLAIYSDSTSVLILDGKQQSVAGNIVLGAIRGRNKTYEVTLDLSVSESNWEYLVVGYTTGTGNGGKANLVVSQVSSSGVYDLNAGSNSVAFVGGQATLYYTSTAGTDFALSWAGTGVTVTYAAEGEEPVAYTSGTVIEELYISQTYVFTVTSTSVTNTVFELTETEHDYS